MESSNIKGFMSIILPILFASHFNTIKNPFFNSYSTLSPTNLRLQMHPMLFFSQSFGETNRDFSKNIKQAVEIPSCQTEKQNLLVNCALA